MAGKSSASIYDVAGRTGLSASTVRRVLSGAGGIAEAERRRVLGAAKEAGLRKRVRSRKPTIGIIMHERAADHIPGGAVTRLSGLVSSIAMYDYAVELFTERNTAMIDNSVLEGVLLTDSTEPPANVIAAISTMPTVAINRPELAWASSVTADHRQQGEVAMQHLLEKGHRKIAILSPERDSWPARQRLEGFTAAAREADGVEIHAAWSDRQSIYSVIQNVIDRHTPTAIFFAGESLLPEATYVLRTVLGLRIPQDISVIGMEAAGVTQFDSPAITAIAQPSKELVSESVRLLMRAITDLDSKPERIVLRSTLIKRDSVMNRS